MSDIVAAILLAGLAVVMTAITYSIMVTFTQQTAPAPTPELFSASISFLSSDVIISNQQYAVYVVHTTIYSPQTTNVTLCVRGYYPPTTSATPVTVPGACSSVVVAVGTKDYSYVAYVPVDWLSDAGCSPDYCPQKLGWEIWLYLSGEPVDAILPEYS